MIVVPNKFIFLATPRTGSQAIAAALRQVPGSVESKIHHVEPEQIDNTAEELAPGSSTLPRYTIARDPYTQMVSWYYHFYLRNTENVPQEESFIQFVTERQIHWLFGDRLNPYHEAADEVFLYEPDLQFVVQEMCDLADVFPAPVVIPKDVSPPGIGVVLTPASREAINVRYPRDVEYYYSLLG